MTTPIPDLSFRDYTDRQYRELEPERLLERTMELRPSGNYKRHLAGWEPQPYPGFAVVSMLDENPGNESLSGQLTSIQEDLLRLCPWKDSLYFLPASSFHQTVANTLSEDRFLQHILHPGLEPVYPGMVAAAFGRISAPLQAGAIRMKMIGLGIFGTALGLLGVFEEEESYRQVLHFRSGFYADEDLAKVGVKRTRPFIGHITLAYIETALTSGLKEQLAGAVFKINQSLSKAPPFFVLSHTELRRYEHLSEFALGVGYPRYSF